MSLPRVGISACLLGHPVRWDGGDKGEPDLVAALAGRVEWVPVCPELELGMGVPRPPVRLVQSPAGGARLIEPESGRDWTEAMEAWAERRVRALAALSLSGYVLKSRSPSCAARDAPLYGRAGEAREKRPGLFAALLLRQLPGLPVEDESRLSDSGLRRAWLERVAARHRSVTR